MNTAMKLMMKLSGSVFMDVVDDLPAGGGGGVVDDVQAEESQGGNDDLDWLLNSDDDGVVPITAAEEEPQTEEPEQEQEQEQKEETETEVVPESKKDETVKEEEKAPEQVDTFKQLTPEEISARKEAFRAEIEKQFAISEDDANLLVTAPEKVYPKLASNLMMRTLEEVQTMQESFLRALPNIIQTINAQSGQEAETKNKFLELTPALKGMDSVELEASITALAPLVKKRLPNASLDERMKLLGKLIATANGLEPAKAKPAQKPAAVKPYTPAAPARSSAPVVSQALSPMEKEIDELLNCDD